MAHQFQHAHHHLHQRDNVATAVKVVYVTASPTFDGPIGGYSTATVDAPATSLPSSMPSVVAASSVETSAVPTSIVASSAAPVASSVASSSALPASSSSSAAAVQSSASPIEDNAATTSSTAAPAATSSASSSQGMSTGAQAGLAIGILLLAMLVMTGAFLFYRSRKSKQAAQQGEKLDNEKSPFGGNNSAAPRLSLGNAISEKSALSAPVPAVTREAENPFGDHNKLPEAKLPGLDAIAPKPQEAPRSTSPTENANNVHRVQLDFNPSMDDELELRQGQLVRLLHEYDDGWCLCIRLDRSQQGVVPRSCISKAAMKPRPAGPPPAQRPQPANNGPRARSNSSAPRPTSPNTAAKGANGPFGEGQYRARSSTVDSKPAGLVAAEKLSSSPNNSSPESTSPTLAPARKPVPGQAV